jgi:hypothetical protein
LNKTSFNIKENSWLAKIAAWKLRSYSVAIVMGKTIHLHNTKKEAFLQNTTWLKHELCHIKQFTEHGYVLFIVKYLWESIKNGYHNNKYETEARAAEEL